MQLTLTVLRCPDQVVPETRTVQGGEYSVGRGPGVDWILPDPERLLSKRHFAVAYRGGAWQIADTSTNGTTMNTDAAPIGGGDVRTLRDGDRLKLGAYEIEVRLQEDAMQGAGGMGGFGAPPPGRGGSPFGDPFGMDPMAPPAAARNPFDEPASHAAFGASATAAQLPHDFDPLAPEPGNSPFLGPTQADHSLSMDDAFRPPPVIGQTPMQAGGVIPGDDLLPDDWDKDLLEGIGAAAAAAADRPVAGTPSGTAAACRATDGAARRAADGAAGRPADGAAGRPADGAACRAADGAAGRAADGAALRATDGAALRATHGAARRAADGTAGRATLRPAGGAAGPSASGPSSSGRAVSQSVRRAVRAGAGRTLVCARGCTAAATGARAARRHGDAVR